MKETKPILFIAPVDWNYYPYRDQELPEALSLRGYDVVYLNPVRYSGHEDASRFTQVNIRDKNGHIRVIDRSSPWQKGFPEFIRENIQNIRAIARHKPAAVVSTDHLMAVGACLYCRIKGIRFIFDVTDDWEAVDTSLAGKVYRRIIKPLLARFSYAVCASSQRQYDNFSKRRRTGTYLISNGVNPKTVESLQELPVVTAEEREVNFIGSLRDWYDFEMLFRVFRRYPQLNLNIYGDGPLYPHLKEMAAGISNIRLKGSIENRHVPGILAKSLFGVLPLKMNTLNQSTCPIKLFDYWAASKAVIASPLAEVRRVGGDSLLYAESEAEFTDAVKRLLEDSALRKLLGGAGRKKVEQVHNYEYITQQFLKILEGK
ncbi:MAG: glycosyltransferase [Bacteroidales bacterium]|nr:glycosyltransferase [Bacteroidales bacterium]